MGNAPVAKAATLKKSQSGSLVECALRVFRSGVRLASSQAQREDAYIGVVEHTEGIALAAADQAERVGNPAKVSQREDNIECAVLVAADPRPVYGRPCYCKGICQDLIENVAAKCRGKTLHGPFKVVRFE